MTELTYKDAITQGNLILAENPQTRFIGYGLQKGRALGTLKGIDSKQIIETPVAENLMIGLAIGLSLTGLKPVVLSSYLVFM